jgi:hypothetical protein
MTEDFGFLQQNAGNDPLGMLSRGNSQLPDLLTHLHDQYKLHLAKHMKAIQKKGGQLVHKTVEEAAFAAPVGSFLSFAQEYLNKNRPTQVFPVDSNTGIVLSNHVRVCVSPGIVVVPGSMEDSGAVGITHGMSQPGMGGTEQGGAVEIR